MSLNKGNCYLCGKDVAKGSVTRHLRTTHCVESFNQQDCVLLKIEDAETKHYWLFLDLPVSSTLRTLDAFLREIWLECCNHMSAFRMGWQEVGKTTKLSALPIGTKLQYEYDFGSTTELCITVVEKRQRPKQRKAVRLLVRNIPYVFPCSQCGQESMEICRECCWEGRNPFYCQDCKDKHEHDMYLPVVNSPRMGECCYFGEQDDYEFDWDMDEE